MKELVFTAGMTLAVGVCLVAAYAFGGLFFRVFFQAAALFTRVLFGLVGVLIVAWLAIAVAVAVGRVW